MLKMNAQGLSDRIKINITITLTIGFISLALSSLVIGIYIAKQQYREILKFAVTTLASSAGITSAFYVGQTIKINAESNKIDRTIACINRWNDPNFLAAKQASNMIHELIKEKPDIEHAKIIDRELEKNLELRQNIIEILNLLEQIAIYIDRGIVDKNLLHEFFVDIVIRYGSIFKIWIEQRRNEQRNDRLYEYFTSLYKKWKE